MRPDRREFLFSLASMAAAPPRFLAGSAGLPVQPSPEGPLSVAQTEILTQFCEQLIPADEFPGARELGVADFIRRVLKEAHPEWTTVYRAGLDATDASCRTLFQTSFLELNSERQIEVLEKMERGDLPAGHWVGPAPADFFSMVRSHAMQGFYSHPQWGGNRDKQAWKMIGYDDWWV